jgi:hypothetical protein
MIDLFFTVAALTLTRIAQAVSEANAAFHTICWHVEAACLTTDSSTRSRSHFNVLETSAENHVSSNDTIAVWHR